MGTAKQLVYWLPFEKESRCCENHVGMPLTDASIRAQHLQKKNVLLVPAYGSMQDPLYAMLYEARGGRRRTLVGKK